MRRHSSSPPMALLSVLTALLPLAIPARLSAQDVLVEDRTKHVCVTVPEGFLFAAESTEEMLVFEGPKLSGGRALVQLQSLKDGRPVEIVLAELMAERIGEDGTFETWEATAGDNILGQGLIFDHLRSRKALRTGLAAGRVGPWVVVLVAEAPTKLFHKLDDDWAAILKSVERLPIEPLFSDAELGFALHYMPDWMPFDTKRWAPGQSATWSWTSDDKQSKTTVLVESQEAVPDLAEWAEKLHGQFEQTSELSSLEWRPAPVCGRDGYRYDLTFSGGYTGWVTVVQNEKRLIRVTCQSPTEMLDETFAPIFKRVVANLELLDG